MKRFIKFANLVIPALVVSTLAFNPAYSFQGFNSRVGKMATFEYLRVSLVAREQGDLFAKKFDPEDRVEKRKYLENIFTKKRWDFEHQKRHFTLLLEHRDDDLVIFRIGRQKMELGHDGPDENFPPVFLENWELAWAVFDIDPTSQLFIVQNNIGSPKPLIRSLLNRIESNSLNDPYEFEVEYLSERSEFWNAADEYRGRITRIEFSFLPPNALGLNEKIRSLIVAAKTQLGAETTSFVHTNEDGGLHPEQTDEYTTAALETASAGGGSTKMKSGRKVVYSSSKNRKTTNVDKTELPENAEDTDSLSRFARTLRDVQDDD